MNIIASSPEGLEKVLAEEISNYGGNNILFQKDAYLFDVIMRLFIDYIFFLKLLFVFIGKFQVFNVLIKVLYMKECSLHLIG